VGNLKGLDPKIKTMNRPNPDELLARVQQEERRLARGRLKIFFGAAAGVGKTYAMLQAAHEKRAEGVDVVAGYIQPHGRKETEALLEGLEELPYRLVEYRGATLREFDLDAALARAPDLLLVDELAHTNAPGSRHAKRWQDVEELLEAGIDVYTTVNVQHIESLNDVVAQITQVIVRETVPDKLVEQANEVELIDLTPDDLLQRLKEGKIYLPGQAERAVRSFFRKGNLIALRELALRRTADRVDAQMRDYRRDNAIGEVWPANERLLVCVGPGPGAARLVRAARRMATRLRAEWIVLYVETPAHTRLNEIEREQIVQTLRLAEQLGAETVSLSGAKVSEAAVAYARQRNASKIVVGKPLKPRWRERLFGSVVDEMVRANGVIDVYVLSGDFGDSEPPISTTMVPTSPRSAYLWGLVVVLICTLVARAMLPLFDLSNLIMVYLVGIVAVASRFGRGPSIMASFLSVLIFDFFFVPPYLTLAVSHVQYVITFAVMLLVALTISALTVRARRQAEVANQRERRAAALYELSRQLSAARDLDSILRAVILQISGVFEGQVTLLLPVGGARLQPWGRSQNWWGNGISQQMIFAPGEAEIGVAQWVFEHRKAAGRSTSTLPGSEAIYLPLHGSHSIVGVLGLRPTGKRLLAPEQLHLLETFASQTALAIERTAFAEEAQTAQISIATERMRNSLLSSVSHDLRTPLTAITGAASALVEQELDSATRRDLAETIYEEGDRLNRLVTNLLEMTRIEAGSVQVQKEWQPLEEVLGAVLRRLEQPLAEHELQLNVPPDLPLVPFDGVLIEQVLVNLLENALKYTPEGSRITLTAHANPSQLTVEIADNGPGLPPGDEERVFEKFYRAGANGRQAGSGLGLTICRGIIEAHGGQIWAYNEKSGGAVFAFTLPIEGAPPKMNDEKNDH
jgi:two-component system, OmpR family, sensor histidine kinase KdpD